MRSETLHPPLTAQEKQTAQELLESYGVRVEKVLRNRLEGDSHDIQSATHDAMIEVAKKIEARTIDRTSKHFGLLFCIATRKLIDIKRQKGEMVQKIKTRKTPRPRTTSIEILLNNRNKSDDTLADVAFDIGQADQALENIESVELIQAIQSYVQEQADAGEMWAKFALEYYFNGLTQTEAEIKIGVAGAPYRLPEARKKILERFKDSI